MEEGREVGFKSSHRCDVQMLLKTVSMFLGTWQLAHALKMMGVDKLRGPAMKLDPGLHKLN